MKEGLLAPQLAPPSAPGWTHVWDGETQLAISDETAGLLSFLGIIEYSGLYRVYTPRYTYTDDEMIGVTNEQLRSTVLRNM